jgi:hypothetical protein
LCYTFLLTASDTLVDLHGFCSAFSPLVAPLALWIPLRNALAAKIRIATTDVDNWV